MKITTSWMMMIVRVTQRENEDSRYTSHEEFDEIEIITKDTKEELLAECYGIRERNKPNLPLGAYDGGVTLRFHGPIEVVNNNVWVSSENPQRVEYWYDTDPILCETTVGLAIDSGAVLHQILK